MKKFSFCLFLIFFSIFLYAEKPVFIYDELQKIASDVYYKFYESNNRVPISFNDFLENLPEREDFNDHNTRGLIDIFINSMGWTFTYLKIDENNFELSVQHNNIMVMYQSKTDMIFLYENCILIRNDYCGTKTRYLNNKNK